MSAQPILQHLEQRVDLIQRKICELYEQQEAIQAEIKKYKAELAKLRIPEKLLPCYRPKGFSPLGRPVTGELRKCLLCDHMLSVKRSRIEEGGGWLCAKCQKQHSVLRVKDCPRCNGHLIKGHDGEIDCLTCGFSRPLITISDAFYILQLN